MEWILVVLAVALAFAGITMTYRHARRATGTPVARNQRQRAQYLAPTEPGYFADASRSQCAAARPVPGCGSLCGTENDHGIGRRGINP